MIFAVWSICHVTGEVSKSSHLDKRSNLIQIAITKHGMKKFSLVEIFIMKMPSWTSLVYPVSVVF